MKFIVLALFCVIAYVAAQAKPESPLEAYNPVRFRREANPQGSLSVDATVPIRGNGRDSMKGSSLDVNYNQRVYDRNGMTGDAYGGLNIRPGQPAQPHLGFKAERNFRNGYINGYGQVQRGPGGRASPSFGVNGGFRFRRDVDELMGQEQQEY